MGLRRRHGRSPWFAPDSVYRGIEKKGLPGHKMGRLLKLKISDVDEWVRQGGAAQDSEHGDTDPDRLGEAQQ